MEFRRATTALTHASYVFGLTFFSTLSTKFMDQAITNGEFMTSLWAAFIASGISFFSSMAMQGKMIHVKKNGNGSIRYSKPDSTSEKELKPPKKEDISTTGSHRKCLSQFVFEAVHGKERGDSYVGS